MRQTSRVQGSNGPRAMDARFRGQHDFLYIFTLSPILSYSSWQADSFITSLLPPNTATSSGAPFPPALTTLHRGLPSARSPGPQHPSTPTSVAEPVGHAEAAPIRRAAAQGAVPGSRRPPVERQSALKGPLGCVQAGWTKSSTSTTQR